MGPLSPIRPAILRTPPEVWQQITKEYLNPKDTGNVRLLCREIYNKPVSVIKHIKITKTEDIPRALTFFKEVEAHTLTLEGCRVDVDALKGLSQSLKCLNLIEVDLTDEKLTPILLGASNLNSLKMSNCSGLSPGIFAKALKAMGKGALKQLKVVNLHKTGIRHVDLVALMVLAPNVTALDLSNCSGFCVKAFIYMLKAMGPRALAQLKIVNLSRTWINNADLRALIMLAQNITALNVDGCRFLHLGIFVGMLEVMEVGALEQLKAVNLSYTQIDEVDLRMLMTLARNVIALNVGACENLYPDTFVGMLKAMGPGGLKRLNTVNLFYTKINNADLKALMTLAPNVTALNVSGCANLSAGVLAIMRPDALAKLKAVNLSYTKINDTDFKALLQHSSNLSYLCLRGCQKISRNVFKNMDLDILGKLNKLQRSSKLVLPNENFILRAATEPTMVAGVIQRLRNFVSAVV